jgi:biotin carboxyl carrier protein
VPDRLETTITPLADGRVLVDSGDRRTIAYAVTAGTRTWVFLNGRTFVVESEARDGRPSAGGGATTRPAAASAEMALSSPMPAMVVSVGVSVGQAVTQGDVLMTLEAMKMELPIRAPRSGTVKAIACRPGELVQPGIPLVELA